MRIFILFELLVILVLLYLIVNIVRYAFLTQRDEESGSVMFGLSDRWLREYKQKSETKEKERIKKCLKV